MTPDPVSRAEGLLHYAFVDREILRKALTHGSFSDVPGACDDYERLEFLGDAVLELLTREYLLDAYPLETEGMLTRRKIVVVRKKNLAVHGMRLGLDGLAFVGHGYIATPGARRSLAADLMESVIGAIYADSGLQEARNFVRREILERTALGEPDPDPRSMLQEYCQSRGLELPVYRTRERSGPDHSPLFTVSVSIEGKEAGAGSGPTRKAAREEAARMALNNIERTV